MVLIEMRDLSAMTTARFVSATSDSRIPWFNIHFDRPQYLLIEKLIETEESALNV